jgi:hypothetical protein
MAEVQQVVADLAPNGDLFPFPIHDHNIDPACGPTAEPA